MVRSRGDSRTLQPTRQPRSRSPHALRHSRPRETDQGKRVRFSWRQSREVTGFTAVPADCGSIDLNGWPGHSSPNVVF